MPVDFLSWAGALFSEYALVQGLCSLLLALLLDRCFAEPSRFHPLVGFGRYAYWLEARLNTHTGEAEGASVNASPFKSRLLGGLALGFAVIPFMCLAGFTAEAVRGSAWGSVLFGALLLYLAIGWQSLLQHAQAIAEPLDAGDLPAARAAVSMIVSRDALALDESGVAKAATESVLENGGDAIFSAIFWFLIAGAPGVVLYRLANTLDAMWGYKNARFLYFGWASARFDDVLNFVPARLTALSYALMGSTQAALQCWKQQGFTWKSPNAGPVMSAGAGALNVSLGGAASYHNGLQDRPALGPDSGVGMAPSAVSVFGACALVNRSLWLWCALLTVGVTVAVILDRIASAELSGG